MKLQGVGEGRERQTCSKTGRQRGNETVCDYKEQELWW